MIKRNTRVHHDGGIYQIFKGFVSKFQGGTFFLYCITFLLKEFC
jgi:hypothetical protein